MTSIISDKDRIELSWIVMLRMRVYVKIEVNPTVTNAYLNFRRYYISNSENKPHLYLIIIAVYLMTLKNENININIPILFHNFLNACIELTKLYNTNRLISIMECKSLDIREISSIEEKEVRECEMDIVEALNFNMKNELPFKFIEEYFLQYLDIGSTIQENSESRKFFISEQNLKTILTDFERNLYPFFYSEDYFEIPNQLIAAIAFSKAIKGKEYPPETQIKLHEIQEKYEKDIILHAGHVSQQRILLVPPNENAI